ncbi:MAG: MmgE/PrpD family protein [Limnohabitans sp.]|nr:MmgE/PrpD family protein [Limnohabitans sp.]
MNIDSSQILAQQIASIQYSDLPKSAIDATRCNLLDTIGVALAGATAPGCKEVVGFVLDSYSGDQATVWGTGRKTTAAEAALANGTLAHALDFDDTHDAAILHAGVSIVPATLAVAEYIGGVSGKELITALSLGLDITCRMGIAAQVPPVSIGWVYTTLFGLFGATAAAAKIVGLNAEQTGNALGVAYAQAAGNCQCIPDGSLTKRMQPGFAARAAVLSVLLVQRGITGSVNSFEGQHGLARVYLHDQWNKELLLDGLGKKWHHEDLAYKPYPTCRHTHNPIDVALQLTRHHDIEPGQVESISVGLNEEGYTNLCTPIDVKLRPKTVVHAQFSIPFCIATAICRRDVFIDDMSEQAIHSPDVLNLASKVKPYVDVELQRIHGRGVTPAKMTIQLRNGATYKGSSMVARGGVESPMNFAALVPKFRRCLNHARASDSQRVDTLVEMLLNLENLSDVRKLMLAFA